MLLGGAISLFGAIILVQVIGSGENINEIKENKKETIEVSQSSIIGGKKEIKSPIAGKVIELSKVDDPVFSSEAMGNGVAIKSSDNKVYSPFNGTVQFIADTKHAIGLISDDGIEILIHVGMDTVKMNGKGFDVKTAVNSRVKEEELLLEFDIKAIEKEGYQIVTPVIITNSDAYNQNLLAVVMDVDNGKPIIDLKELSVSM